MATLFDLICEEQKKKEEFVNKIVARQLEKKESKENHYL